MDVAGYSPPSVSICFTAGNTPKSRRMARTWSSLSPQRNAICVSAKPSCFAVRRSMGIEASKAVTSMGELASRASHTATGGVAPLPAR